jgi:hypothetical protein
MNLCAGLDGRKRENLTFWQIIPLTFAAAKGKSLINYS